MQSIIKLSSAASSKGSRNDDDFWDRLSHRYTKTLLVLFAIALSTNQLVGKLINCWVPAHFSKSWQAYTNSYCWVKNTYWLPFYEYVPKEQDGDQRQMVPYYQWVPIILLIMALGFHLPIMLWRALNMSAGVNINNIVESAEIFEDSKNPANTKRTLGYIITSIDRYVESHKYYNPKLTVSIKNCISRVFCLCCGRRFGNYLATLYIFTKLLFIANCIAQVLLLNLFMGHDFTSYGFDAMKQVSSAEQWPMSPRFPRVTMCDFYVRFLGNVQRYTVQCALPINLFNEKVFLFIWVWIFLVMIGTIIGGAVWVIRSMLRSDRIKYIKNHLRFKGKLENCDNERIIDTFVDKYLQQDGVLILRLIGHNTNAITITEITCALFEKFKEKPDQEFDMEMQSLKFGKPVTGGYYA